METHSAAANPVATESVGQTKERYEDYFIRAVSNAIDILEMLSQSPEPVSLVRVAEFIGQSKSSVFRILCTLEHKGLIERCPGDVYVLSNSRFSLKSNQDLVRLKNLAEPVLRELSREFRETISLAYLFENHIEVVTVIDSPQRIRMYNVLGSVIPPHASSVGKCIVAYQSEERREHLVTTYGIHPFTAKTILDATELDEEFRLVREQGFAVDREESTADGCCFGAPIWTAPGYAGAAVSLSLPKVRLKDEKKIIAALRRTAKTISDLLAAG